MSAAVDEDLEDLLPEHLMPGHQSGRHKKGAVPLVRSAEQASRAEARQRAEDEKKALEDRAKQLAQMVNLHIAGYSLADIGASIGATEAEVDRMLTSETARYVKTQPALRTYVRNWISGRYLLMLEADWDEATDRNHAEKLENQDRVMRILDRMAKLHGAEMPTQSEVKVDAAPEAVDRLVQALANGNGMGYDTSIFDVVPGSVVHEAAADSARALEVSGNRVEESSDDPADDAL